MTKFNREHLWADMTKFNRKHLWMHMTKFNKDTMEAVHALAQELKVEAKDFSTSTTDSRAATTQRICVWRQTAENVATRSSTFSRIEPTHLQWLNNRHIKCRNIISASAMYFGLSAYKV
ncbi:hypothetical protein EG329_003087 [Mollisiaceae sp. DMI_Dod_QoI]|nr:hypothetical protein EG329_003087 [Helotiales sp. DMI_Dod_QoI]